MTTLQALPPLDEHPLTGPLDAARRQERERIGDDLHDEVAQILFAARLSLEAALQRPDLDAGCEAAIARSRDLIARADDAIRLVIHGLAHPDSDQFDVRLRAAAARVQEDFQLPIRVDLDDEALDSAHDLSPTMCDGLVRVAREALTNSAKHAGPCCASLQLTLSDRDRIVLTVADDGRSAATARPRGDLRALPRSSPHGGHGLAALRRMMAAQGAELSVRSDVGGTTVCAEAQAAPTRRWARAAPGSRA